MAKIIAKSCDVSGDSNFLQGCQFSPDGLCVLTCSAFDNTLRLYNTPPSSSEYPLTSTTQNSKQEKSDMKEQENEDKKNDSTIFSWQTILSASVGDNVRNYKWYPLMNSYDPTTCAFIAASRDQPIHLFDAYTSSKRASYCPYNGLDEMEAPNVVTFSPNGDRIFASGFRTDRMIHIFHTSVPGRNSDILRLGKTRRSSDGQKGIVSELSFPDCNTHFLSGGGNVFAVGTYSPGSIYIYDDRRPSGGNPAGIILNNGLCIVGHGGAFSRKRRRYTSASSNVRPSKNHQGVDNDRDEPSTKEEEESKVSCTNDIEEQEEDEDIFSKAKVKWYQKRARGGVTQLQWSRGGASNYSLYSASRRSDAILAWDMRMLTDNEDYHQQESTNTALQGIASYPRDSDSNQRIEFDQNDDGTKIYVGSQDNCMKIYDVKSCKLLESIDGFHDAVNGVSFHHDQQNNRDLVAVATGARRFNETYDSSSDEDVKSNKFDADDNPPGSLQLLHF